MPSSPRCARSRSRASSRSEMDEHRVQSLSRTYAPERVRRLAVAATTASSSRATRTTSRAELSRLPARARPPRADLAGRRGRRSTFSTDERLRLGEFGIQARLVRPPSRGRRGAEPGRRRPHDGLLGVRPAGRAAARARPPARHARGCASTAAPSVLGVRRRACSAARATATSCSTTRTSRAATPRCGPRAARGSSATSARPTASRSTAAASTGARSRSSAATSIELGTSRVTFELE